jgi:hypothetical protein
VYFGVTIFEFSNAAANPEHAHAIKRHQRFTLVGSLWSKHETHTRIWQHGRMNDTVRYVGCRAVEPK